MDDDLYWRETDEVLGQKAEVMLSCKAHWKPRERSFEARDFCCSFVEVAHILCLFRIVSYAGCKSPDSLCSRCSFRRSFHCSRCSFDN